MNGVKNINFVLKSVIDEIIENDFDEELLKDNQFKSKLKFLDEWCRKKVLLPDIKCLDYRNIIVKKKESNKFWFLFKLNTVSMLLYLFVILCVFIGILAKYLTLSTFYEKQDALSWLTGLLNLLTIVAIIIFIFLAVEYRRTVRKKSNPIHFREYYWNLKRIKEYLDRKHPDSRAFEKRAHD